jgi:hypothetical protein
MTPLGQPVLTVGPVHLAAFTVGHALHDDAERLAPLDRSLTGQPSLDIRACRVTCAET